MLYAFCSTRSREPISFEDVTIGGTCPLGGLYVPDIAESGWPVLPLDRLKADPLDYRAVAKVVLEAFSAWITF